MQRLFFQLFQPASAPKTGRRSPQLPRALTSSLITIMTLLTVVAPAGFLLHLTPLAYAQQTQPVPPVSAAAAPPIDLAVSPPVSFIWVKPGQRQTVTVTLSQFGTTNLEITPRLVDFSADGKTGQPILAESSSFEHLTFSDDTYAFNQPFSLAAKKSIKLRFDVHIPSTFPEKEYPLTLLFSARPNTAFTLNQSSVQTTAVVGGHVIVRTTQSSGDQSKLSLDHLHVPRFVDSFSGITYGLTVRNDGATSGVIKGTMRLKDTFNRPVQERFFYPDLVLANSTRDVRGIEGDPAHLDPKKDVVFAPMVYKPPFLLGIYTIETTLNLTNTSQGDTSQVTFLTKPVIAFPFSLVGILFLGIGLFVLSRYLSRELPLEPAKEMG